MARQRSFRESIGTVLLAFMGTAILASACQDGRGEGGSGMAGAGGEDTAPAAAGSSGDSGSPGQSQGGASSGGFDTRGGATAGNGEGAAESGGGSGMPGTAGESSAGGAGTSSLACSQNQPLGPHLGTHVLTVSYDEQLCIFHSDDPEVVPPGCGEREPIDEGTITLSVFKPRDLSWQTWALLDGSGVTIGPEGTTNPEWWPGPLTTDGVNRMPTVRFAVSLSDGVCSSKPIAAEDGGEAQVDFHWPTGRVTDFVRRCRDEFRTLYYEYRVTGSGAEGCDLAACNDLVNNAPPAEVNRTRPTVPYGQAVPLAGGDGQVAGGTYHLKAVDYPSDPTCNPVEEERPSPISETLVVTASSPTSGIMSWVSERATWAPTRSSFSYEVITGIEGFTVLKTRYICGEEVLSSTFYGAWWPDAGEAYFSASGNELSFEIPTDWCSDGVSSGIYTYEKQ